MNHEGARIGVSILKSIQVGKPQERPGPERDTGSARPWRTALYKEVVEGPVRLRADGLAGDAQADLRHHGGPDKGVCVYPAKHYAYWAERLGGELPAGAFGENFSVVGQDESSVCIGDTLRIGGAVVQLTQPRSPCWKIARRWDKRLAHWFQETGLTGWYLRVRESGVVEAGQSFELLERPFEHWSIERLNLIRYGDAPDRADLAFLAQCGALSSTWRTRFAGALAGDQRDDSGQRLEGPP